MAAPGLRARESGARGGGAPSSTAGRRAGERSRGAQSAVAARRVPGPRLREAGSPPASAPARPHQQQGRGRQRRAEHRQLQQERRHPGARPPPPPLPGWMRGSTAPARLPPLETPRGGSPPPTAPPAASPGHDPGPAPAQRPRAASRRTRSSCLRGARPLEAGVGFSGPPEYQLKSGCPLNLHFR